MRLNLHGVAGPTLKTLVFAVVTVMATGLLALGIAGRGDGDDAVYKAVFTDVTAMNPGDDVRMAGVKIGEVTDIRVVNHRYAEVEFAVSRTRPLSKTVVATARFRNLIGQRYISLGWEEMTEPLPEGATIPLRQTRPALDLTALLNGFRPLFRGLNPQEVNDLSYSLIQVLQGEEGTVSSLVDHLSSLTSTLADKDKVFGDVIDNLNTVLAEVTKHDTELSELIGNTEKLVAGLAKDAKPIGDSLDGLSQLSEATADLLKDGRAPLKKDIKALGDVSKTLAEATPAFEKFLANLPVKYEAIGKIVSYGSWVNLYLCEANSDAPRAPGGRPVGIPLTDSRCRG